MDTDSVLKLINSMLTDTNILIASMNQNEMIYLGPSEQHSDL